MGVVRNFAQQCGVGVVGRREGRNSVPAAMAHFAFGLRMAFTGCDAACDVGTQLRPSGQFIGRCGEDRLRRTENLQQVNDPRLGLCLDVGHANTCVSETPPMDWIAPMAPWLRHVHLHNNQGDTDLHAPLGEGNIPMRQIIDTVLQAAPEATFTIENQNALPSLHWLAAQGYIEEPT